MFHPFRIAALGLGLALGACVVVSSDGEGGARIEGLTAGSDGCGASSRQDFVGKRVDVLNNAELPEPSRVLFPGMTAGEVQETRLTITVDGSDSISRVYCG